MKKKSEKIGSFQKRMLIRCQMSYEVVIFFVSVLNEVFVTKATYLHKFQKKTADEENNSMTPKWKPMATFQLIEFRSFFFLFSPTFFSD